ncbi:MerR family transcriptional regulator [Eggerthellaceae bacterium zg-887]|uniref:MerR family transcriptional regulator n=1 Tax=Xiamenia xianingshaonis TaxID=2682776 RepID=UPI001408357A|nr:MerR family transcriptional regulator [Xiamenia xianingshaonis]NHM16546.1 MerR family transcriptional regulator [Xiamenia xianingshaonis]
MFRIGEFSKMAMTTVKTLRYYDEVGLLKPREVDRFTGYRLYDAAQLVDLHRIQSLRQAGLPIGQIARIASGGDAGEILRRHSMELEQDIAERQAMLSRVQFILKENKEGAMPYTTTVKHIPEQVIYCKEYTMRTFADYFKEMPALGEKLRAKYPDLTCAVPAYCYTVNLDREWRETDNHILYCEAVTELKDDFDGIRFEVVPALDVASVMHQGPYEDMGPAFAHALEWVEQNGYEVAGDPRTSYIDGIWNKDDPSEWLTEVQIPIRKAANSQA